MSTVVLADMATCCRQFSACCRVASVCIYLPGFKTCSAFKWDYSSTTWSAGYRPWSQLFSPGLCFVTCSVMCDYNSTLWLCY